MATLHYKIYEHKDLFGQYYTFPKRGIDGIPMHTHEEDQKHNVIVIRGSIEIYGPEKKWARILKTGEVMDLEDEHHPHELVALEDDTQILSFNVHGRPKDLPANFNDNPVNLSGTINKGPLTIPFTAP